MNRKNSDSISSANRSSLDTFHGLATTCLSSAERLTALNLASARGMLDDTVAASRQRPSTGTDLGFNHAQMAYVKPVFEKAVAYSYSVFEILLESQQEIIHTLSSQFSSMNANFKAPANWTAPFEMFTKGMQDVSSLAKRNVSATTEATKSAITESLSRVTKVA